MEPNIYISPEMQELLTEIVFGIYDIAMATTKQPVSKENAKRAADDLKYVISCVQNHDPEEIVEVMIELLRPRAANGNDRIVGMYNEAVRLKHLFEKDRKASLN